MAPHIRDGDLHPNRECGGPPQTRTTHIRPIQIPACRTCRLYPALPHGVQDARDRSSSVGDGLGVRLYHRTLADASFACFDGLNTCLMPTWISSLLVIAAWMERKSPGVATCRKAPRLAGRFGGMNLVHGYIIAISTWRRRPPPPTTPSPNCEPTVDRVSPSIARAWKGGGRGSGSPLTRAFAGSKPPLPPAPYSTSGPKHPGPYLRRRTTDEVSK
ncbi:hypothetical protein BU15DRAFT_69156 [Melanogaster broomeanus]|nr:hypothetical protein BU15DRAFT_69156 [Melanogaster broomeanus]